MTVARPTEKEKYSAMAVENILQAMEKAMATGTPLDLCFSPTEMKIINAGKSAPVTDLKQALLSLAKDDHDDHIVNSEMQALLIIGKIRPGMIGEAVTLIDTVEDPYWQSFLWGIIAVSFQELGDPRSKEAFHKIMESAEKVIGGLRKNTMILVTEVAITLREFVIALRLIEKVEDEETRAGLRNLLEQQKRKT